MKRWLALLMVLTLCLTACAAVAEEPEYTSKGSGSTCLYIAVYDGVDIDDMDYFAVHTDKTLLLDALQGVGLVDGEAVDWGYFLTTVNGKTADYDGNGEYWTIQVYDANSDNFVALTTAIGETTISDGDGYLFMLRK